MTTPRMRTAEGALSILKETDPGTAVTLRFIRRLIVTGAVPHVPVGRKKLVDVDRLMDYLKGGNPIWVQGEEGAKAFMVAPGNSVMLMDSENTVFYLKSSDQSGMPLTFLI